MEWQHIPPQHRNGILLGYNISYFPKKSNKPIKHETVDNTRSSTTLLKLKKYTWYVIRVAGYTSKGLGPHPLRLLEIRTSEDGKCGTHSDLRLPFACFVFLQGDLHTFLVLSPPFLFIQLFMFLFEDRERCF